MNTNTNIINGKTMKTSEFIRAAVARYLAPDVDTFRTTELRAALCFCFGSYQAFDVAWENGDNPHNWREAYPELCKYINEDLNRANNAYLFNRRCIVSDAGFSEGAENFKANQMDRFVYAELMALFFGDLGD